MQRRPILINASHVNQPSKYHNSTQSYHMDYYTYGAGSKQNTHVIADTKADMKTPDNYNYNIGSYSISAFR